LILFGATYWHLRAHYAGRPMLLVCAPANIAYARLYLRPERIMELNRVSFRRYPWYRVRRIYAMARAGIGTIVQPARNREHMVEDALVRASGAAERIGATGSALFISESERVIGDGWYTRLFARIDRPVHEAAYFAGFAAWLTGSGPARLMAPLPRPARHPDLPAGGYLVVASEASSPLKVWPLEHFLAAAAAIAGGTGLTIVLIGENATPALAGEGVIDLRGRSDMSGMAAVLAHARLVLCNDSGPAHLAAVLGVPVVAVGSGAMPERYLPYTADAPGVAPPVIVLAEPAWPCFGCGWQCVYRNGRDAPVPCITAVTVAAVVRAAMGQLLLDQAAG
jgi:hypothetical protein